ncbi:AAA family ATPase [Micromonospora aurantiaca (nom. illeg.)]|uniref:AAA family ATPase n=1 Tax=Micromonospora aurantiaca (nom. illeg.) TaxID=47850 RepID=UPI0033FB197B
MARIALIHLTFVGKDVEPATIDFGPKLTVIYGASDTGKSFIADSIDFAMGSSKLRSIRESEPYSHILLGIKIGDESLTLVRALSSGIIRVHNEILRELPSSTAFVELKARHTKGRNNTISAFLLERIGLYGKVLRKNSENKVVELTLRQLAPFFVVHEGQMVALTPPYHPVGRTDATAELSLLRVLLEGDDDSELEALVPDDVRKVSRGKYEVLQQVLSGLFRRVEGSAPANELQRQLEALGNTIAELTPAIDDVLARRQSLIRARDGLADDQRSLEHRVAQMMEITARFTLLRHQYQSDLARLEAVQEAGNILGFFQSDICFFCGAAADHQDPPGHAVAEAEQFAIAIVGEQQKTADLLTDLQLTLADLEEQVSTTQAAAQEAARRTELARDAVVALDSDVTPQQQELAAAYAKQSQVTHMIAIYKQIEEIETLASTFATPDGPQDNPAAKKWPSLQSLNTLSVAIKLLLDRWGIETGGGVAFDTEKDDLLVDGRPRNTRGKGMRSMIHASFTLGLAEYCDERGLPHPGVTVLDSPLVTYRQPEPAGASVDNKDEYVSVDVAAAFYKYLDMETLAQTVVIENTTPPAQLSETAVVHHFTKQDGLGRYGFFPNH